MKKSYIYFTLIILFTLVQLSSFAQDWNLLTIQNSVDDEQLIRVDNDGTPHILVHNDYYKWNGIAWDHVELDNFYSSYYSFCLDANGSPHFAHRGSSAGIYHSYFENNVQKWDTIISNGTNITIAIFSGKNSSTAKPEILYYKISGTQYTIYLASYDNTEQKYISSFLFNPGSSTNRLYYPYADFCLDSEKNLYYVYENNSDEIIFNFYDGETWSSFNVTDGIHNCSHPRIVLDQNNIPHITYYDDATGDLIHAKLPAQSM